MIGHQNKPFTRSNYVNLNVVFLFCFVYLFFFSFYSRNSQILDWAFTQESLNFQSITEIQDGFNNVISIVCPLRESYTCMVWDGVTIVVD